MYIVSGTTSIQLALDLSKSIKASKELMDNIEVKIKIVELMDALVEAKNQMIDKDKTIIKLKKQLQISTNIFDKDDSPFIWMKNKEGKEIAYCPKCYAKDNVLAKIMDDRPIKSLGTHQCPVCETWFGKRMDAEEELDKAFNQVWG